MQPLVKYFLCMLGLLMGLGHIQNSLAQSVIEASIEVHKKIVPNWTGWGTSLCWWAKQVGDTYPNPNDPYYQALTDKLYHPKTGLGLTIFRYNIGGGANPASALDSGRFRAGGEIEGWATLVSKSTSAIEMHFKPHADEPQMRVLKAITSRHPDIILEAFSNAPPYFLTNSGSVRGGVNGAYNFLGDEAASVADKPYYKAAVDAFATYLIYASKQIEARSGHVVNYLEPFNEPDGNWWKVEKSTQEGCALSHATQKDILARLKASTSYPLAANDANNIDQAAAFMHYMQSQQSLQLVDKVNTHSYFGTQRTELAKVTAQKPLWQSESGPLQVSGSVYDVALKMASRITTDITHLKPNAWLMWQVLDNSEQWCSFKQKEAMQGNFLLTPWGTMFCHFSRFIRPGDAIVDSGSRENILASVNAEGTTLTVVVVNPDMKPHTIRLHHIQESFGKPFQIEGYKTTPKVSMQYHDYPDTLTKDGSYQLSVEPQSVVTLQFFRK